MPLLISCAVIFSPEAIFLSKTTKNWYYSSRCFVRNTNILPFLPALRLEFSNFHRGRRLTVSKLARACVAYTEDQAAREKREEDRTERKRIQARTTPSAGVRPSVPCPLLFLFALLSFLYLIVCLVVFCPGRRLYNQCQKTPKILAYLSYVV